MATKEKKPRLTKKQRGFVKDYIETGSGVVAARNNYDVANDNTARAIASENLTKPIIVNAIEDALPDELLAQVHLEGLRATKIQGVGGMLISAEGIEHADNEVPDYATRHKYLDSAYKLKGSYAAEKHATLNVNVDVVPEDSESLDLAAKLYGEAVMQKKLA